MIAMSFRTFIIKSSFSFYQTSLLCENEGRHPTTDILYRKYTINDL